MKLKNIEQNVKYKTLHNSTIEQHNVIIEFSPHELMCQIAEQMPIEQQEILFNALDEIDAIE